MVTVRAYEPADRAAWDRFIDDSKNGTFLFKRAYMDYHADRFVDASLLFLDDAGDLVAVMPASRAEHTLVSHGGLTYGGIVSGAAMKTAMMLQVFDALVRHARERQLEAIVYKAIPHIYHALPAEEDLYALFRHGAALIRRDVSSTILLARRPQYSKGRKHAVKKGRRAGMRVERSRDFRTFMALEEGQLQNRHGVGAVHSAEEMELLASRFPEEIQLFTASLADELLAGVVVYVSRQVAHAQYIGATDAGREVGAPDALLDHLLTERFAEHTYFDFGISTEQQGRYLNEGLILNKESFGARATVYDFYRLTLT